jgi:hypothetical protein
MEKQNDILDKATEALKNEQVPTAPPQNIIDSTIAKLTTAEPAKFRLPERRRTMKMFTKIAAAAAIIIVVALLITLLNKSATPAYALQQTLDACQSLRNVYFQYLHEDVVRKEASLEYDRGGQIKNVRVDIYKPHKGVVVWKNGQTQFWNMSTGELLIFEDEPYTRRIMNFVYRHDPIRAVEYMHKLQEKGDVTVEIKQPSTTTGPIVVEATYRPNTYLLEATTPPMREVFLIDQPTKLITAINVYEVKGDEQLDRGVWKYGDFDKPFSPDIFDLNNEVPPDVRRVDMMALDLGVQFAKTDYTEEQMATETVRLFFKAWIAKDYDKTLKIWGGYNPDRNAKVLKILETLNPVRITGIGNALPPPRWGFRCLTVPCEVEFEKDGQLITKQLDEVMVYPVLGHPDRRYVRMPLGICLD